MGILLHNHQSRGVFYFSNTIDNEKQYNIYKNIGFLNQYNKGKLS